MGVGLTKLWFSAGAASNLNWWTISPAPLTVVLICISLITDEIVLTGLLNIFGKMSLLLDTHSTTNVYIWPVWQYLLINKSFFLNIYFSLCVWVFCLSACMLPQVYRVPAEVREGLKSPETGVTEDCELPCGCWEPSLGPLQEQQKLLTIEPRKDSILIKSNLFIYFCCSWP